jgi:hypothetical protein
MNQEAFRAWDEKDPRPRRSWISDGVPEDLPAALQGSVRGLVHPPALDRPQDGQHLRRRDLGNRPRAQARIDQPVRD